MSERYTYLLVNLCCLAGPLLLSFYPKFSFYRNWRYFIVPCLTVALLFLCWDILYTNLGVWGFNQQYTLGWSLFGLPLEEYLFFLCIPFACVFTYHAFSRLFVFERYSGFVNKFYMFLSACLLLTGLLYIDRLYTSATFLLLAFTLAFFVYRKPSFLPGFFFSFLFILIPFVLSNGILTGSFIGRTVVHYNDQENIGLRLLTIPVEDIFYGKLLLLLNVWGYDYSCKKAGI
jgi:lycopene cyclase domain